MAIETIRGLRGIQPFFDRLGDQFTRVPLTPFLREEMGNLADAHDYYFRTETGPDGNQWKPNADSTVFAKGHDLVLRGKPENKYRLSKSLTRKTPGGDAVREIVITDSVGTAIFGTEVEYSIYHDEPGGRLPWRPHIGVPQSYFDRFAQRALDYVFRKLQGR